LEGRDEYTSPTEVEPLRRFLAGEPDDLAWLGRWMAIVRKATAEGRRYSRVRIVSIPLSDYSRFGLWCAEYLNTAGEDIRYLPRDQAEGLPDHDFWLFDESRLARMHYDESGRFLGAEVIEDPPTVAVYRAWKDMAWQRAVRRDDFAAD
jgi:hypothetical protein